MAKIIVFGIWEQLMNQAFNCAEFDTIKSQAGLQRAPQRGKKLLAQGNALGNETKPTTPCKGKSHKAAVLLVPLQGEHTTPILTQGVALSYRL